MNRDITILFTGDSITDGNRYKKKEQEWDLNHQIGHSYVYILNGLIGALKPELGIRFKNRGISGNRISDLLTRMDDDLFALKPDIISVLVGVNDGPISPKTPATSPENFESGYRKFIAEISEKLPDAPVVIMEPFVCCAGKMRPDYGVWRPCVSRFAAAARKISEDFNAVFVPLQQKFDEKCAEFGDEFFSWDGVHPTENGHGLIALEWLRAVRKSGILSEIFDGGRFDSILTD